MTYNVLMGTLNPTGSLWNSFRERNLLHYITYKFRTRPTCQFASESGALRWRQIDYT